MEMLSEAGFDEAIAHKLAAKRGVDEIRQQIEWLDQRKPSRNRLGMLRKAIEENWPSPVDEKSTNEAGRRRTVRVQTQVELAEANRTAKVSAERQAHRRERLTEWQRLDHDEQARLHQLAITAAASTIVKRRLRSHTDLRHPPTETLRMLNPQTTTN